MKLVFVYLGDKLPKYVALNVRTVQRRFPSFEVVLVLDSEELYKECKGVELPVKLVESPRNSWRTVKDTIGYSADFRDDFWFKTVARFDALRSFMLENPNESLLHIEADVLLTPKFPLDFFKDNKSFCVAYPLTNFNQGVASTFYVKDLNSLEHFLHYCEKCFEEDGESTDVSILGSYYQDFPTKCFILPTVPDVDFDFNQHVEFGLKVKMSENYKLIQGIFDASTWGQFLTGHDPKNSVGFTPIFVNQNHHAIRTDRVKFRSDEQGRVYIILNETEWELFSLHVHSKNEKLFNCEESPHLLKKFVGKQGNGVTRTVDILLFLKLLPGYIKYRIRLFIRGLIKNGE